LPFFKRVKILHFTPFELPRTATRKVKRGDVVEMLQNLEDKAKNKAKTIVETKATTRLCGCGESSRRFPIGLYRKSV
jgi:long-chain acyl-CoA synthetase